jgi:hypothetical protein
MTDHTKEGLLLFSYECDDLGIDLACWFEYEPAEVGYRTRFGEQLEPDYPATWSLHHVYLPGSTVDIAPVMNPALVTAIEEWVAGQADEDWPRRDDYEDREPA